MNEWCESKMIYKKMIGISFFHLIEIFEMLLDDLENMLDTVD